MEGSSPYQGYNQGYNQPMTNQGYNQGYNQPVANQGVTNQSPNQTAEVNQQFMIASIVSWVFVLVTGWISFRVPDLEKAYVYWDYIMHEEDNIAYIDALYINYVLFYIIAVSILVTLTVGFLVFCYSVYIRKDANVINAMQGGIAKFHFIPFICISILFIIGETVSPERLPKDGHYIGNLLVTLIALVSAIYLNIKIKVDTPLYASIAIKHGALSCFIGLLVHDIGYVISEYGLYRKSNNIDSIYNYEDEILNWLKGCQIAFSIIVGIGNSILTFILKEISISVINLLCYIGMLTNLLKMNSDSRKYFATHIPVVVDIIMIIISLLLIAFFGKQYRGLYLVQHPY